MRRLVVFNQVSLDGYFTDQTGDMSWAKQGSDAEFDEFTRNNARGGGVLLFGRLTYELMASFWPTQQAARVMPEVAEQMNTRSKLVISKTLAEASWNNTRLVRSLEEICQVKETPGEDIVVLGSGRLVSQLAAAALIDEYQLVLNPLALGAGRTIFEGLPTKLNLRLTDSRTFKNGKVFLRYEPT